MNESVSEDIYSPENIERSRARARGIRAMVEDGKLGQEWLDAAAEVERYADERESVRSEKDSGPWRDNQGDVWWLREDGLLHTPETRPFSREHVEKKWGPLVPVPTASETGADRG